jgi:hypothetical protein
MRFAAWLSIASLLLGALPARAEPRSAAGPPVHVAADRDVSPAERRKIERVAAGVRPVRPDRAVPAVASQSSAQVAKQHRVAAVRLALERATDQEGKAAFDACVREAASALDDASTLIAETGDPQMLRSLHLQIGSCMVLGPNPANARPHFISALLLDERLPPPGRYREEVEAALADAHREIGARSRGRVSIVSDPPGAQVWIDGRKLRALTPLTTEVRLGDHFVTLRRFRFEPRTERVLLVPSSRVTFALEPAGRGALREQLAAIARPGSSRPRPEELRLATAVWAGADQVLVAARDRRSTQALTLRLLDATSGRTLRTGRVTDSLDDDELTRGVCRALGASCEPSGGVPWYVWPIAGAAVVGGVAAALLIADKNRDVRFCPPSGCN